MQHEKDIFNNNIKKQWVSSVIFALVFSFVLFLGLGIAMLLLTQTYDKIEPTAKTFSCFIAIFSIFCSVVYPIISVVLIRHYPKHRKLAHMFIKEIYFEK